MITVPHSPDLTAAAQPAVQSATREHSLHPRRSARRAPHSQRRSRLAANTFIYVFLAASALMVLTPFFFAVITAVKTPGQFATSDPTVMPDPITFDNFRALFTDHDFIVPLAVTVQVVVLLTVGQIVCSVLAAYAFAMLRFPGRDAIFWVFVATLMIPAVVTIIPLYSMFVTAGLRNTFAGLVVPFLLGSPYAIFLLRESMRSTPQEIIDAAIVDGAGPLRRLYSVVVPMNKPAIATLTLITVVSQWNNFMWPSVIAPGKEWSVLTVATASLQTQYQSNWTLVMAAAMLSMAPLIILFIIFQKQIVSAIGVTGVR